MTRLERLYELRSQIDDQIRREVAILEAYAREQRKKADETCERPGWAPCGTDGGYYRHRRTIKEPACEACKEAHRQAERDRQARRNARLEVVA